MCKYEKREKPEINQVSLNFFVLTVPNKCFSNYFLITHWRSTSAVIFILSGIQDLCNRSKL